MNDKAIKETINHAFKVQGTSTDRCLEPTEQCQQPAIRSHSIPCGTVLRRLSHNGHVVMPQMKLKVPPPAEIEFKQVGINKASTFSGLCEQHDNDIFRPIDDDLPDLENDHHLFLLAYRAVLREYHAVLQNAVRFQSTYLKRVEVGLSPGTEPCDAGMFATSHICNAIESYEYKRTFDKANLENDFSHFDHHVVFLEGQAPTIAVNSMFSLDDLDAPQTPRVTLSIYPTNSGVAVVFSAIKLDAPFVAIYLDRLLSSQAYFQKYLLSKLVDNVLIDAHIALGSSRLVGIVLLTIPTPPSLGDCHDGECNRKLSIGR